MTTRLSDDDYLAALDRSASEIAELTARLDPTADVPTCPGWSVRDLIAHLGGVHGWARGIVAGGSPKDPRPEPEGELAKWYADQARQLLDALRATEPDTETWTFSSERTAGFWFRRKAHETEMHRIDLLLTAGGAPAYDEALAADAVTEVLEVMLPRMQGKDPVAVTAPIRFVSGDTGDEWVVRPASEPGVVDYTHSTTDDAGQTDAAAPVEVTVTAPASDLATGLWGRTPYVLWSIDGDRDVLDTLMRSTITP